MTAHTHYDLLIHTAGDYDDSEIKQFSDIRTCVSKDLRPGFEGHDEVYISWTTHNTHGMYVYTYVCVYYLTGLNTVRYKILEGENFGEMAHCNNWRIIFWRMPKSS